jgi:hypothetical protein
MSDGAAVAMLHSPLAGRLIEFNLLPARGIDAGRLQRLLPQPWLPALRETAGATFERHCSAWLLETLGLRDRLVTDGSEPALPIALAPAPLMNRLRRALGLVQANRRIRHAITREQAQRVAAQLDAEALRFARLRAPQLSAGEPALSGWPLDDVLAALDLLGAAVLERSVQGADPALAERARLRWPDPQDTPVTLAASAALALARAVLEELDSAWLSSFPHSR